MVDLIPADYRRGRRLQQHLARFAIACAAVLCAVAAVRAALDYALHAERTQGALVSSQQSRVEAIRGRAAELDRQKLALGQALQALDRLHGSASIEGLFTAVDAVFDERIWFRELSFSREAGSSGAGQSQAGTDAAKPGPGPAASGGQAGPPLPPVPRELAQIHGHAMDHSVLAEFVRRLQARDGIAQVRLRDTTVRSYTNAQVVDFTLELVLAPVREAGR